jgi:dipeptidyl aminopeptidase/acylaminoacyl peptidase
MWHLIQKSLAVGILFICIASGHGQSSLSIEQIMQGPDFVGHLPGAVRWGEDNKTIYFSWNPEGLPSADTYKWSLGDTSPYKLSEEEFLALPGRFSDYSADYSKKVYAKSGDLYLADLANRTTQQITFTTENESQPFFTADEKHIGFIMRSNLFLWSMESGSIKQITNLRSGSEKPEKRQSDQEAWLERDQLEYFEILAERKEKRDYNKEKSEKYKPFQPKVKYYEKNSISGFSFSPDNRFVTYRITKAPSNPKRTKVPDFVTESGYINNLNGRPKVGSPGSSFENWIYDMERDSHYRIDVSTIPGIKDKPSYYQEYHKGDEAYVDTFKKAREVIVLAPEYNPGGDHAVVVVRSQDHKDRWIMELNPAEGKLTLIDWQHDEAWIGGPGVGGWSYSSGTIGWIDNETLYFQSEETGFSHLYAYHFPSGKKTALTEGKYEVTQVQLSRDKQNFFLQAYKESPFENHFYRMPVHGGGMEKITRGKGSHQVFLSPNEQEMAILYSYSNKPWEVYYQPLDSAAERIQITASTTDAFEQYSWREPEIIWFPARDSVMVPARLYKPVVEATNGAGVIFVHGAGYLHNVHSWWSSYYREYMFHNFLADNGYTVMDIDYRASAGYGRDWRTAIYRYMGGKDLDDNVDGARYMADELGVDANRIGIYGGSYGGFITLMALCTAPGTFKCGAALRSVTDWAHYNHGYTSNILNTPVEDSIAYYRSSPIYHAEGLQGDLVMLHGMVDTNVQFQDVVRMAQRFIELGKENWELAVFPMEGHGFIESSSWTDEYKRIFNLFQRTLLE